MGASASTNVVDVRRKLSEDISQTCVLPRTSNSIVISGSNFKCMPGCRCNNIFRQDIASDGECMLNTSVAYVAATAADQNAKADTGLGFAVSTNVMTNISEIQKVIAEKCGNEDNNISNAIRLDDANFEACGDTNIVQNISARTKCALGVLNDMADNITLEQGSTSTGFFGGTSGMIAIIVIVVVLVVIGSIGAYYYTKTQTFGLIGGTESDGLFDKFTEELSIGGTDAYPIYIFAILVIALLIWYANKPSPNAKENMANVNDYITEFETIDQNTEDCCSVEPENTRLEINQSYSGLKSCRTPKKTSEKKDTCARPYYETLDSYYEPLFE